MILHREGSVSMPGVNDEVQRHARIRISYQDVDGNMQTEESDGLRAVCHQHEIDQLNGQFWINRLSRLKREQLIKRFEKLSRRPWGGLAKRNRRHGHAMVRWITPSANPPYELKEPAGAPRRANCPSIPEKRTACCAVN
jgi:hypothetical protein